jgi:hypothetical protein
VKRIAFTICIATLLFIVPVRAVSQPELAVVPESQVVIVDDEFEVEITVDSTLSSLMGYDVTVSFDASIIEFVDAEEGPLPMSASATTFFYWWQPGGAADTVAVNGAVLGTTVDGPGTLFKLKFKAKMVGTTTIEITRSDLRTGTNTAISHTTKLGTVIVDEDIPVESVTWGRLKSKFR